MNKLINITIYVPMISNEFIVQHHLKGKRTFGLCHLPMISFMSFADESVPGTNELAYIPICDTTHANSAVPTSTLN